MHLITTFVLAFVAISQITAYPYEDHAYFPEEYNEYSPSELIRQRRSFQAVGGGGGVPQPNRGGWKVSPSVRGDERGNTHAAVGVQHTGPKHDVNAHVSKVVRGQDKGKKTWHVGGVHRFRRSFAPGAPNVPLPPPKTGGWQVSPQVSGDPAGNTRAQVDVSHTGPKHQVNAGIGQVVKGPAKSSRPTWHVGGSYNW